jgi:hypothetical protein
MTNKFEQLLDYLVNEEMDKANELFHEIVVEKSRDIYENLIAEEAEEDEEEMEESSEEDDEEAVDEESELEEETTLEIGGDPTDAMAGDMGAPGADMGDMGGMDDMDSMDGDDMAGDIGGGEGTPEERIDDLEDALEELKAEFEALMAGEEGEEHMDDEEETDDEEGEENPFGGDEGDEEETDDEDEGMFEGRQNVREYRSTVGNDWDKNSMKTPGPVGSGKGDKAGQTEVSNLKSPVSSGKGKPTTGASAHNILANTKGVGEMSGTSPNMDKGSRGVLGATKGEFTKGVEKNISNKANSSMKSGAALSKVAGGHGAEKKGTSGEGQGWGSGSGGKSGQTGSVNTKSPLTGAPNRNA